MGCEVTSWSFGHLQSCTFRLPSFLRLLQAFFFQTLVANPACYDILSMSFLAQRTLIIKNRCHLKPEAFFYRTVRPTTSGGFLNLRWGGFLLYIFEPRGDIKIDGHVATSLDVPINWCGRNYVIWATEQRFHRRGLGDIVIPGIFFAIGATFDHAQYSSLLPSLVQKRRIFILPWRLIFGLATQWSHHVFGKAQQPCWISVSHFVRLS